VEFSKYLSLFTKIRQLPKFQTPAKKLAFGNKVLTRIFKCQIGEEVKQFRSFTHNVRNTVLSVTCRMQRPSESWELSESFLKLPEIKLQLILMFPRNKSNEQDSLVPETST
jgi:hypothetical protein